jgi:uncharacterized protein
MDKNFLDLFKVKKPIIGMIHLKGNSDEESLQIAKKEIDILMDNGIDAVLVENYFGYPNNVEDVLAYLYEKRRELIYGVNILGNFFTAFNLANKYQAKFIQIDSVVGHLNPFHDFFFARDLKELTQNSTAYLLGGVRFKYQPVLSNNTLEEDLKIAMKRCDAIVVTGTGTGLNTPLDKIKEFRSIIGDFPLVVGAGITPSDCEDSLRIADAGIVGSYIKDNYEDNGDVSKEHILTLLNKVKKLRKQ